MTNRPTFARISLENLRHNYHELKKASSGAKFLSVVKANAYGHGVVEVARELARLGTDFLGVAIAREGVELREAGIEAPILLLGGIFPGEAADVLSFNLTPVVYDLNRAEELNAQAKALGAVKKIHVKIDTGMGRIGLLPGGIEAFFKGLKKLENIEVEGVLSHLSDTENPDKSYSDFQRESFISALDLIYSLGFNPVITHLANSGGTVTLPEARFDMVRPGLMLYGVYPAEGFITGEIELKPVMKLRSAIISLKKVPVGTSISYGRTFITKRETIIATIPAGYADGVPRRLSGGGGETLVLGKRAPIAGVVCMDMTTIDVTDIDGVSCGDEVVIIGSTDGSQEEITALEVAGRCGTIPYEILCNVSARVPRVYS